MYAASSVFSEYYFGLRNVKCTGKSNSLAGLARHIRIHFLRHSLVVIGIKNRGRGTSKQELVGELEVIVEFELVTFLQLGIFNSLTML